MAGAWLTKWFLRLLVPLVLVVDDQFARHFGEASTISRVILNWSTAHRWFPALLVVGFGVLFGHLCCPVKPYPLSTPHYVMWAILWTLAVFVGHTLVPQHPGIQ